ncbi:MAG: protein kinase [Anaerolineae bacterium]|nr:protein kinase [Anaerolineae bacterium]
MNKESSEEMSQEARNTQPQDQAPKSDEPPKPEHRYRFPNGDMIAGEFLVEGYLGHGGFSEVYHCLDTGLGQPVAVKVLFPDKLTAKTQGLEEARTAAHLKYHPNIIPVTRVSKLDDGTPFIVFDYVAGDTLEKRLKDAERHRLDLKESLPIVKQIANALDYAHQRKIIHRDIKPSNIILDEEGKAFLTDFGLAEIKHPVKTENGTGEIAASVGYTRNIEAQQRLSGTIPYMAPEQLGEGKPGDERSDLYSLAVVVYEMLTGRWPHESRRKSDFSLPAEIIHKPPYPPTEARPDLPMDVGKVLLQALDKDPNKRHRTCTEFAEELSKAASAHMTASDRYDQALQYIEKKEWREAKAILEILLKEFRDFKDAEHYLKQAEHQVQLMDLHEKAKDAFGQTNYQEALDALHALRETAPNYDTGDLLERAQKGRNNEQYRQASQLFADDRYSSCLEILDAIRERDAEYPDPENLRFRAKEQVKWEGWYKEGLAHADREEWKEAIAIFEKLKGETSSYPGVETQLTTARYMDRLFSLLQEANDCFERSEFAACVDNLNKLQQVQADYKTDEVDRLRQDALDRLHEQVLRQLEEEYFVEALQSLDELQARSSDYADMEDLRTRVDEGTRKQALQKELDRLYEQARSCLHDEDYPEAAAHWQAIRREKGGLDYPDPDKVQAGIARNLYRDARMALAQKQPRQALELWEHVRQVDPDYLDREGVKEKAETMAARQKAIRTWAWRVGGGIALILLIVIAVVVIRACNAVAPTATPTKTPTLTPTSISSLLTKTGTTFTPTSPPAPTTRTPTSTPTPATPSATSTSTSTPTPTLISDTEATVSHPNGASIFAAPDANSQVLGSVSAGEIVEILGRSAYGRWFYVRNARGVEGFAYRDRFKWSGQFESLPIKTPISPPPVAPPASGITQPLEMDLWDLPDGRCSGGVWYRRVYIAGHGGDGAYTYYWKGEKLAGPTGEGYTFEVHSTGGALIGAGRVDSGDGQKVERDLYISPPSCHQ